MLPSSNALLKISEHFPKIFENSLRGCSKTANLFLWEDFIKLLCSSRPYFSSLPQMNWEQEEKSPKFVDAHKNKKSVVWMMELYTDRLMQFYLLK